MKRLILAGFLALIVGALAIGPASGSHDEDDDGGNTKLWRVTIQNLTPPGPGAPGSQPLSPPLFVVHTDDVQIWRVGQVATHVVAAIAEGANNEPAISAYTGFPGVRSVFTGAGGPIPSGASATYTVQTRGDFDRLSIVTMLVNTNDAFTGTSSLELEDRRMMLSTRAYDAGSEKNNELKAFIPGPCCGHPFVRDPEGAPIRRHPGITGVGDLDPALYGWDEPVAKITITRA
jgi:Spondin_N